MEEIRQETFWTINGKTFKSKDQAESYKEYVDRVGKIEAIVSNVYKELTGQYSEMSSSDFLQIDARQIISMMAMRPQEFRDVLNGFGNLEQVRMQD
ncbi:MAG: hypothetical protein AB7D37_11015 [Desulfovibrio sp.]